MRGALRRGFGLVGTMLVTIAAGCATTAPPYKVPPYKVPPQKNETRRGLGNTPVLIAARQHS